MVLVGGYWFWFFIRVDVTAEGHSPFRLVEGGPLRSVAARERDARASLGRHGRWRGRALLALHPRDHRSLLSACRGRSSLTCSSSRRQPSTKRVSRANGTAENLPTQTRDDPEQQKRHSMELLQDAPMDMGLGIKREAPRHY